METNIFKGQKIFLDQDIDLSRKGQYAEET